MRIRLIAALFCIIIYSGCGSSHHSGNYSYYRQRHTEAYATNRRVGKLPHSDVPLAVNDRVLAWIDYFTGPNRDRFERYLQRSGRYMTLFRQTLRQHGLPEDLVYVALIESGFSNRATSFAAAAGTWQFIQSTGRHYGLGIDTWIDERRDPEKAVDAAARYLKDLYREFGDWYLAMAGYNAGEGRVRQAIAKYGTKDFWELTSPGKNVFRPETRDYVPKFIAAAILAKHPEQYGFHGVKYQAPWQYERVRVDSQTDLQVVADCAGVSLDDITDLNPDLRSGLTPPGSYEIRLPVGLGKRFHATFAKVPRGERVRFAFHTVGRHDTLPKIARQYGVSVRNLMAANGLRNPKELQRGDELKIPRGGRLVAPVEVASASTASTRKEITADRAVKGVAGYREAKVATYKVRRGDSLATVAAHLGVTVANLREWNGLTGRKLLRGQQLQVGAPRTEPVVVAEAASDPLTTDVQPAVVKEAASSTNYTVRRGDSWIKIAERHAVSVKTLKSWNAHIAGGALKIGQRLNVSTPVATASPIPPPLPEPGNESTERMPISQADPVQPAAVDTPQETMPEPVEAVAAPVPPAMPERVVAKVVHKEKTKKPSAYVVRSGDTLAEIADAHDMTVAELQRVNRLQRSTIRPGQRLILARAPSAASVSSDKLAMNDAPVRKATASAVEGKGKKVVHKVRPGDTIWDLSRLYKVTPEQIKSLNNLPRGVLKPGQNLTIRLQTGRS